MLEYDDLMEILLMDDFHPPILRDCILWCVERDSSADQFFFEATVEVILKGVQVLRTLFPRPHQVSNMRCFEMILFY